ncbi:MAG: WYL domain-containing protein [Firmicutes bacterium]|nr:WYL domain-containing protein [Bacillota bacterium]
MAKSSNQKLKLMYLARILMKETDEDHGLTMPEIIDKLGAYDVKAERKSIYDDIESLQLLGMDVVKRTEGGRTEYALASRTFELVELKLLVDAVQSSRFITKKKTQDLIKKIESMASSYQAKQLSRQVHVANRIKNMNESIYYVVDDIHGAMLQNRQIAFQYVKWNVEMKKEPQHEGKTYVVSPWALMWDDENYYLVAYDGEAEGIRHYRVDKMVGLKICDEQRNGSEHFKHFDKAIYSRKTFGMFNGRDEHVTLRCENSMADAIIDRFGHDVLLRTVGRENFDVTVKVSISPVFLTWLMNFGGKIRILSPQWVIDEQIKLAKAAIEQYEKE